MGSPSHEATGSRRSPLPPLPLSPTQQVRNRILDCRDSLRRALEELDRDDVTGATWVHVAGHLTAAGVFAAQAGELATIEADVFEAVRDPEFDQDEVIGLASDPFLHQAGAGEGGVA